MLDEYVYRNLNTFGNCVIGHRHIRRFGEKKIIDHLREEGFNVELRVSRNEFIESKSVKNATYILEVKRQVRNMELNINMTIEDKRVLIQALSYYIKRLEANRSMYKKVDSVDSKQIMEKKKELINNIDREIGTCEKVCDWLKGE